MPTDVPDTKKPPADVTDTKKSRADVAGPKKSPAVPAEPRIGMTTEEVRAIWGEPISTVQEEPGKRRVAAIQK